MISVFVSEIVLVVTCQWIFPLNRLEWISKNVRCGSYWLIVGRHPRFFYSFRQNSCLAHSCRVCTVVTELFISFILSTHIHRLSRLPFLWALFDLAFHDNREGVFCLLHYFAIFRWMLFQSSDCHCWIMAGLGDPQLERFIAAQSQKTKFQVSASRQVYVVRTQKRCS